MGLLDLFRSPEKQIELENKELAKPNRTVAEVVAYTEYDREETYEDEDGNTQWRTIREALVTFRYMVDGQWRKADCGPAEGFCGYRIGDQEVVKYNHNGIINHGRRLRRDSPNRI